MDEHLIGRRGFQENEWSWEPGGKRRKAPAGRKHLPARFLLLAGLALFATVAGVAIVLVLAANDGRAGPVLVATPTPTPAATPGPAPTTVPPMTRTPAPDTPTPTPAPRASPAPQPTPGPQVSLLAWNESTKRWETVIRGTQPVYREGEPVPFMLYVEGAEPGTPYEVAIYPPACRPEPATSFDYLAGHEAAPPLALLTPPGPARERPDSVIPVPDDPSTAADNAADGGRLGLWGGVFQQRPAWQPGSGECPDGRVLVFQVKALSDELRLVWAGHLATAADWPGGGAAAATETISMTITLDGAQATAGLQPGAVGP